MPGDEEMRQKLESQDYLTTVVEQDNEVSAARVTGVMIGFIPPADRAGLIAKRLKLRCHFSGETSAQRRLDRFRTHSQALFPGGTKIVS